EEQAHAVALLVDLLEWRGAREQEHPRSLARLGGEDFAPVDQVVVAVAAGRRLDVRDVVAGVGLGDGECYMHLAADDPGQVAELLLLAAVEDERADAEDRKMDRTGRRHRTASGGDFAHHEGGLGDSKSAAAVALRDRDAEVAGSGDGGEEVVGKFGAAIVLAPVLIGEV